MKLKTNIDSVEAEIQDDKLILKSKNPLKILSSAVLNGGTKEANCIINVQVAEDAGSDVDDEVHKDARDFLLDETAKAGISEDNVVAIMTAARMKNVEVKFPLIEDITMEIAKKYGMIQPNEASTKAVRAVFFVDPKGIIRAIIYYPLSLGRNFDELYRVVVALKTADEFGVATPADWNPGDDVIIGPAGSCGTAQDRMEGKEDMDCKDWYFCTRKIDKELVLSKVLKN